MPAEHVISLLLILYTSSFAQDDYELQTTLIEHQAKATEHATRCMNDLDQLPKQSPADSLSLDSNYIIRAKPLWDILEQLRQTSSLDQSFFDLSDKADSILIALPEERKNFGDATLCFDLGGQLIGIVDNRVEKSRSAALLLDERELLVATSLDIADWLAAGKVTGHIRSLPAIRKVKRQLQLDDEKIRRDIRALRKANPNR